MNPFELLTARPEPPRAGKRLYAAADYSRLTADWAPASSSADAEIVMSLRTLRNRSRALIRDNEYARSAWRQTVQNVIGTGIGLQPVVKNARDKLIEGLNDDIQEAWHEWWMDRNCVHTAGLMNGPDLERFLMGNVFESGEAFLRLVRRPFGTSKIPLAIEVLESDRVMDQWTQQTAPNGNLIRMGIEMDQWHRPLAYWCWPVHPGDWQFSTFAPSNFIRMPAADIIHLYVVERWPQSRGVPWMAQAMKRLNNMGGYENAEIIAARASAAMMGFVESPETPDPDDREDDKQVQDFEPGQIRHLLPGEKFNGWNPSRPTSSIQPFLRLMLQAVAAGTGMSYETISCDYTQAGYSSIRASMLAERDMWRVVQRWFVGAFRHRLHREFMEAAVLSGQLPIDDFLTNERKYTRAHFKPRGWMWIDPTKEVTAYTNAVRAGFNTVSDVIEQTGGGRDPDDVFKARRSELDTMAELELVYDTDPAQVNQKGLAQPIEPAPGTDISPDSTTVPKQSSGTQPAAQDVAPEDEPAADKQAEQQAKE